MPTYTYRCPCGHTEDKFLRMSEFKRTLPCPQCAGAETLEKIVTPTGGFVLKGGGYYATDFKHK